MLIFSRESVAYFLEFPRVQRAAIQLDGSSVNHRKNPAFRFVLTFSTLRWRPVPLPAWDTFIGLYGSYYLHMKLLERLVSQHTAASHPTTGVLLLLD